MPELPEVEVIRRSLEPHLVGRRIERVIVRERRLRLPVDATALRRRVAGRRIETVGRRAKYLLLGLDGPDLVALHLGMSGRLCLASPDQPLALHEHLIVALGPTGASSGAAGAATPDRHELRLRDPRRFGLVVVLPVAGWHASPLFRHLGPEPLDPGLDVDGLRAALRGRRAPIKNLLLDARFLVGVGNIYAAEALHVAGIDPRTPAARLGPRRWRRLLDAVREVLQRSIADGGTSLVDFLDGNGQPGLHRTRLLVYGRAGAPCRRCARPVRRIVQAGRSTYFCTRCQR
jgi:formamidopyrimidine-DNA glycosylase